MKKIFESGLIVLGLSISLGLLFTGTFAFATEPKYNSNMSYHVKKDEVMDYAQNNLELTTKIKKKVETKNKSEEYIVEISKGNVIVKNKNTGKKTTAYRKGNAKYLSQVNFYFYDATFILMITDDGKLYANVYSSDKKDVKFRKIKMNMKVESLMIRESVKRFYEYPIVSLYGVDKDGNWEIAKL